jgi:hypothetical protein
MTSTNVRSTSLVSSTFRAAQAARTPSRPMVRSRVFDPGTGRVKRRCVSSDVTSSDSGARMSAFCHVLGRMRTGFCSTPAYRSRRSRNTGGGGLMGST